MPGVLQFTVGTRDGKNHQIFLGVDARYSCGCGNLLYSDSITFKNFNLYVCILRPLLVFGAKYTCLIGFPDSSVGTESICNAGDPASIPGSGRSAGEEIGYPFQYSWTSLVAQLVKNLPAMQETWVRSLGWEDPLEKGKATHSSILAWRIPWTLLSMGSQRVRHN